MRGDNASGRLLSEYWYDEGGIRFKKQVYGSDGESTTTYYLGDFLRVVNSSGSYDTKYIRDTAGTLLTRIDEVNDTFYYHPDHLGSTKLITDSTGEVV